MSDALIAWLTRRELLGALVVAVGGWLALRLLSRLAQRAVARQASAHQALVVAKAISYLGAVVLALTVARMLGLDLTALLATAGVVSVAIGLASQTSLSNLIAGVFLLMDRPFQVGDAIEIQGNVGVVSGITLLSTYVRTFDNVSVRWPNEVVLKATILNYTRYPARRIDLKLRLPFGCDLGRARAAMLAAAEGLPSALLDPSPEIALRGFTDNTLDVEVRVWFAPGDVPAGRTALVAAVHDALLAAGIPPATTPAPLKAM